MAPPPSLSTQKPYQIYGVWYYPIPSAEGYVETGTASWYGPNFQGHSTACGEVYDMYGMTAAHKTLPLGTYVKVTNQVNGRSTVVRKNDRGPFVAGRIIDLSYTAAQQLGSYGPGTAPVRVEAVQAASEQIVSGKTYWQPQSIPDFQHGNFAIQIGAFVDQQNADHLKHRMIGQYGKAEVIPYNNQGTIYYRVQIGAYGDLQAARQETLRLRGSGFDGAFAVASEER
jgi:rare lipoprotein A